MNSSYRTVNFVLSKATFLFVVFSMVTTTACVTLQFSDEFSDGTCHTLDLGCWLDQVLHMTRFLEGTNFPIPSIVKNTCMWNS